MDDLTPHEQSIMLAMLDVPDFRAAWGVDDKQTASLDDLGCVMGLSREQVRRVEEAALRKIRRALIADPITFAMLQQIFSRNTTN